MKVYLEATWFVEGRRHRKSEGPNDLREIPSRLRKALPTSALVVSEEDAPEPTGNEAARERMRDFKRAIHRRDGMAPHQRERSGTVSEEVLLDENPARVLRPADPEAEASRAARILETLEEQDKKPAGSVRKGRGKS